MKKRETILWNPTDTTVENAQAKLPDLAAGLFAAGRKAIKQKGKTKPLHEFRLAVKRFRYTLEIFQPLYGPALDSRLAKLRRIQQYLGAINDCRTTRALVLETQKIKSLLAKEILSQLDSREKEKIRQFHRYWQETFNVPGEEKRWIQYLYTYAGRSRRPK